MNDIRADRKVQLRIQVALGMALLAIASGAAVIGIKLAEGAAPWVQPLVIVSYLTLVTFACAAVDRRVRDSHDGRPHEQRRLAPKGMR